VASPEFCTTQCRRPNFNLNGDKMLLNNKVYDILKKLVQVILPAAATLYYSIAQIWGLPEAENVVGTMAAITTFLGLVIGLSKDSYNKSDVKYDGVINVLNTGEKKTYTLELNTSPDSLDAQNEALFKVLAS
jgi:hypothetical protein